jgi:hypothetical protein
MKPVTTTSPSPPPPRSRRRRRVWIAAIAFVFIVLPAVWLLSHLMPRTGHFTARRSSVAKVETEPERTEPGNFVSQGVRLVAKNGLIVELRVLRPAAVTGRVPLVVLLGGHRTGRNAVNVLGAPGSIAVAALDYPYDGPERPRGVVESLRTIPAAQRALLDTPPAISLALDWLLTQPWVEPQRVELMGVSLGVPFAAVAGGLDDRFKRVWLVHGAADNRAWIASRLEDRIPNAPLRHTAASLAHLLAYGPTFETEQWAPRIAPRRVVVIGARDDEQMPRASVEKLFAACREPKELLWIEGGHVRTNRHDIVRQLLAMARERIDATPASR